MDVEAWAVESYLRAVRDLYVEHRRQHRAVMAGRNPRAWNDRGQHVTSVLAGEAAAYERAVPWLACPELWLVPWEIRDVAIQDEIAEYAEKVRAGGLTGDGGSC